MELNLAEILENVPKGTKLYSTLHGEVFFDGIEDVEPYPIRVEKDDDLYVFTKEGLYIANSEGECMLFPSKENRDWSTFKVNDKKYHVGYYLKNKDTNRVYMIISEVKGEYNLREVATAIFFHSVWQTESDLDDCYEICEKFPLDSLNPFDRVLVRDNDVDVKWRCAHFSYVCASNWGRKIVTSNASWQMCVPYNDDTEYLVGTTKEAPEFYRQ